MSDAKALTQCVDGLAEFGERVVVCFHIVFIWGTHRGVSLHVAVIIWAFKDLPPRLKPPLLPEGGELENNLPRGGEFLSLLLIMVNYSVMIQTCLYHGYFSSLFLCGRYLAINAMENLELSFFNGFLDKTPKPITLLQVVEMIRSDKRLQVLTENHRRYLKQGNEMAAKQEKQYAPCFAVAVRFNGGKGKESIQGWTGLSMVDFDDVPPERMEEVFQAICQDEHTLLAYRTISNSGIRVVFKLKIKN